MKKRILLILLLLLIPFSFSFAESILLGHILWVPNLLSLDFSPYGAKFTGSIEGCGVSGCNVCTAGIKKYGNYRETPSNKTAESPPNKKVIETYRKNSGNPNALSDGTIHYQNAKAYNCNNGSIYNVMNVYFTPTPPPQYTLTVNGNGTATIDGHTRKSITVSSAGNHSVSFTPNPGYQVTDVLIHQKKDDKKISSSIPMSVWVDQNTDVTITTAPLPKLKVRACTCCGCGGSGNVGIDSYETKEITANPGWSYDIVYKANDNSKATVFNTMTQDPKHLSSESSGHITYCMPNHDQTLTVHFQPKEPPKYTLKVQPCSRITCPCGGNGNVGIDEIGTSSKTISPGGPYKIVISPNSESRFSGYTTTLDSTHIKPRMYDNDSAFSYTMPSNDVTLTAHFKPKGGPEITPNYSITVKTDGPGSAWLELPDKPTYLSDAEVGTYYRVGFQAGANAKFVSLDDSKTPTNREDHIETTLYEFKMGEENREITVKFQNNPPRTSDNEIIPLPIIEDSNQEDKSNQQLDFPQVIKIIDKSNILYSNGRTVLFSSTSSNNRKWRRWTDTDGWVDITRGYLYENLSNAGAEEANYYLDNPDEIITDTSFYFYFPKLKTETFQIVHAQEFDNPVSSDSSKNVYEKVFVKPNITKLPIDFKIKHDGIDQTEKSWSAESEPQIVTLVPDNLNLSSYYWTYKTPDTDYQPLPELNSINQATEATPNFEMHYGTYIFKLQANGQEIPHQTIMTQPENTLSVDAQVFSPYEVDITNVEGEYIYIFPVKIKLTPQFPEETILDDNWHWEVWLTGRNNTQDQEYLRTNVDKLTGNINSTASDTYTTQLFDPSVTGNPLTFTTIIPYNTTELTTYWRSKNDTSADGRRIIFNAYARLVRNDGQKSTYATGYSSTTLRKIPSSPSTELDHYITSIDSLKTESSEIFEAGATIPFSANVSETKTINVATNKPIILNNSNFTNKLTSSTEFETDIPLTLTGDYDSGKTYNMLTITGNHQNGLHTAKQKLMIKPNWYIGTSTGGSDPDVKRNNPPSSHPSAAKTNGDKSALRAVSTRDLRWQSFFGNGPLNWGLSTDNKNTTPLLPNNITINSMQIGTLKTGYAVEFEFDTTKAFHNHDDSNIEIDVSFYHEGNNVTNKLYYKNTYGSTGTKLDDCYKKIIINDNDGIPGKTKYTSYDESKLFNISKKTHSNGDATYKFLYYVPGTLYLDGYNPNTDDNKLDIRFDITARRGTTEYFNYNDLAGKLYCSGNKWNGWVFTYDLNKNNLQDVGYNAN